MAYEKDLYQCVMIYDFRFPFADIQLTDTILLFHLCNLFPSMKVESICKIFGYIIYVDDGLRITKSSSCKSCLKIYEK